MSAQFDPYHKWLGILPKDQPPHHYRLLGLETFEDDLQVIESAADRQLGFLRKFQSGEHGVACQKILNEVVRARLCLLKPAAKEAYDEALRQRLAGPEVAFDFEAIVSETGPRRRSRGAGPLAWFSAALLLVCAVGGVAYFWTAPGAKIKLPQSGVDANQRPVKSPEAAAVAGAQNNPAATGKPTSQPDAQGRINLLPLLKSEHIIKGRWKLEQDRLESLHDYESVAQMLLPVDAPPEYTLHITGTRMSNPGDQYTTLGLGLVCGKNDCLFAMETKPPHGASGLQLVDEKEWNNNSTTLPGSFTTVGKPFQLDAIVRQNNIEVRIDGRTIVDWHGDFSRLQRSSNWNLAEPHKLFLAAESTYTFTKATLGPPLPRRKLPGSNLKIGETVELLSFVDLKQDVWNGDWLKDGRTMKSSDRADFARFSVPYDLPDEYELVADIQGSHPARHLYLGLPFQSGYAGLGLGGEDGQTNVLIQDFGTLNGDPHLYHNGRFLPEERNTITATVRKDHLTIKVGETLLFDWHGDPRRFTAVREWTTPGNRLTIGGRRQSYRVHSLKLTRLAPSAGFPKPETPRNGDLLAIVNVDRDTTHGVWAKTSSGVQNSLDKSNGLRFPAKLPADYEFRLVVERKSKADGFMLALPVAGHGTQVYMDGYGGAVSGIEWFEGKRSHDNSTAVRPRTPVIASGKPNVVQGRVQGQHLTFEVNGQKIWDLDIPNTLADPTWLLREGWLTTEERLQLHVNALACSVEIHEARFRPLDENSPAFPPLDLASLTKAQVPSSSATAAATTDQPLVGEGLLTTGTTPVPDAAAQDAAKQKLQDVFKDEYANSKKDPEKLSFSLKLEKLAEETQNDPAVKFVCLDEARKLAAEAGDLAKAFALVDGLGLEFQTDVLELKASTVKGVASKLKGPLPNKELADKTLPLIDQLLAAERFVVAEDLAVLAMQAAVKVKDKALQADTQEVGIETGELVKEFEVAEQACETLKTKSDDAEANLVWGRWLSIRKNNWAEGLKLLQNAGDEKLKDLATRDLKTPTENDAILELGTDWLDYAKSRKNHSLAEFATRALYWLSKAQAETTGLTKSRVELLMEQAVSTRDWNSPMVALLETVSKKVAQRKYAMSGETRHDAGTPFQDLPPEGGVLVGFNCRIGGFYQWTVIKAIQPVYATKLGLKPGDWHGEVDGRLIEIRAREGYAICDIGSRVGGGVDSIRIVFARVTSTGLDPRRSYVSPVIGGEYPPVNLARGGQQSTQAIIGMFGHADGIWRGFGVISAAK